MLERYFQPRMALLWSDRTKYETWFEVELAICRAIEIEGEDRGDEIIPVGTADQIRLKVSLDEKDIHKRQDTLGSEFGAFLQHIAKQADARSEWFHLGLSAADIKDTAFAMQLKQAGSLIVGRMEKLIELLKKRANDKQFLAMIGRSGGTHLEPTTVGLVFLAYYAEMKRHHERMLRSIRGISYGKVSGNVGVYAKTHPKIEKRALKELGLKPELVATQIISRDRHAEYFLSLALIGSTLEKLSLQVRNWQRAEVGEASERRESQSLGDIIGRGTTSAELLCGLARILRGYAQSALENITLWHERDASHSSAEQILAPQMTSILDSMLFLMTGIVKRLNFNEERLAHNLNLSGGLIFSEAVMLALVKKGVGRHKATDFVSTVAKQSSEKGDDTTGFIKRLSEHAEIAVRLTEEEIEACFDVTHHLRHVETIYERVYKKHR